MAGTQSQSESASTPKWVWLVLGGAAVAAAGSLFYGLVSYLRSRRAAELKKHKKPKEEERAEPEEKKAVPPPAAAQLTIQPEEVSKEKLIACLTEFAAVKQEGVQNLTQLRQYAQMDDPTFERLKAQFYHDLQEIMTQVYRKFNTNETAITQAAEKYSSDPAFQALVTEMAKMDDELNEPPKPLDFSRIPVWLTPAKTLEILQEVASGVLSTMISARQELTAQQQDGLDPEGVQKLLMERIQACSTQVLSKFELEQEILDLATMKFYQSDPEFAAKMKQIQNEQQLKLQALGMQS